MDMKTAEGMTERERREFEGVLDTSQTVVERISRVLTRVGQMETRLFGPEPETDSTEEEEPHAGGILGQFKATHAEAMWRLDAVEKVLSRIEGAI